ncbi:MULTISPECIES: hypothetical protein [unclassified Fibrobacter]|uniref:hypothetical protein n=1 Tax=unclassified Fibrobacter TaxID=2634177 RepID=UPI0025C0B3B0|nr:MULTISPECIES: hypothetical protein [unclassified Fibrobacter]
MIVCYKCGGKYEDDMPRCLWCDALNPEHPLNKEPAPSLTEKASAQASPGIAVPPVVKQTVVEQVAPVATETLPDAGASDIKSCETSPEPGDTVAVIGPGQEQDIAIEQQFRQKGVLWSVILAGVFVSWLCHYKYLKKTDKFSTKFFLPLFGIECVSKSLFYMLSKANYSGLAFGPFLYAIIVIIVCLFYWFFIGKLGLVLLKKAVPNYDQKAFKKRERIGIAIGIPIFALEFIAGYLQYGTAARMLGVWLGNALR